MLYPIYKLYTFSNTVLFFSKLEKGACKFGDNPKSQ